MAPVNQVNRIPPVLLSAAVHMLAVLCVVAIFLLKNQKKSLVELEVIEFPKAASVEKSLKLDQVKPKPAPQPEKRAVFGLQKSAITDDTTKNTDAVEAKAGNTVAKELDDLKLNKDDVDRLPIPTDELMVSKMPRLKTEVRIPYPAEAKQKGIEGPVVMDLLIDSAGKVRKVDLVRGPGFGLNEAAVSAIQNFEFEPALVQDQAVAVKIRYTYRFILENR